MSNKWQNRTEIGGILRKGNSASSNPEARSVDLLVFGYACKIFRDDAKAREIDQGKHLIPWMADANLKIDRYDVRGAIYDLAPYEPPPGGYGNRLDYLSSEEQRAEQLCEEERYLYLYRNEQDEILYQEEELKRLQQESGDDSTYNQVQFNYDTPLGPNRDENPSEFGADNEPDKVFLLPKNFEVPTSIQLPETMKQHAIVEKTARFISAQGPQMEILIKAKQSNNQQFDFLNLNNTLNPYYKFVLSALKSGTYPQPECETLESLNSDEKSSNNTANNVCVEDPFSQPYIPVPTIKYTPSANCAYTQLISKIKGVPLPPPEPEKQQSTIYTPVLLQQNANTATIVTSENGQASLNNQQQQQPPTKLQPKNVSNALMLAHYCSSDTDSEEQTEDEETKEKGGENNVELCFPIPPDYLQNIIDKTAGYVIKNGRQFEETLRIKNDERFTFLFPDNEFYSYYMYKVTGENKLYHSDDEECDEKQISASGPVSFSIKIKDEQPVSALRQALPQETSDDETENKIKSNGTSIQVGDQVQMPQQQVPARSVPEHVQKAIQLVESQLMARNAQLGIPTVQNRSRFDIDQSGTVAPKVIQPLSSLLVAVAEQSSTNQVKSHQKELKRAEEKVKDKLAQIAREKLGGLISKEKQLQIERKKKAMAFLNQIKGTSQSTVGESNTLFAKSTAVQKDEDDSDASSIHSIPISSYGDDKSDNEISTIPSNTYPPHEKVTIEDEDDDDEVQLVTVETKKRHSRSRVRQQTQTPEVVIISPKHLHSHSRSRSRAKHAKSKTHKSKKKSSKHSHHHGKKKSKKRSRSHSTYRSQSCYSEDEEEAYSSSDSSSRKRRKRSSSHKKKKSSRRHDK
ncbi:protein suppressor of white apricot [Eupeodes corollae]|uniref:protein suppressor of white apricot n=1 Tax=Eupeodes corollae TaxID=290404 RepID=UPI00248F664D|nr:protein suppressor of white apricot [Eupeodes corollae]